jgi:UDP-N-acetylmuramoyl-L-alanyl-D-glutamate--2,6-diaminopimelate ligase
LHRSRLVVEPDRRRAIQRACASASTGDVVVIAGRGHESVQSVAGVEIPFNDANVAREVMGVGQ